MTTSREFKSSLNAYNRTLTVTNNPHGEEGEALNLIIRDRTEGRPMTTLGITISNRDAHELAEWINVALKNSEIIASLPAGSVVRFKSKHTDTWETVTWFKQSDETLISSNGLDSDGQGFNDYDMRVEYNPNDREEDE